MKIVKSFLPFLATLFLLQFSVLDGASIANESLPRIDSRDGNSVDTATGAFIEDLSIASLQGARSLDLSIAYNSRLTSRLGHMGYGWSHQYEARITGNPENIVTVYINGNIGNQFRYAGPGQDYTPLNLQNRYDILKRFPTGEWQLTRQSGTHYFFAGTPSGSSFELISIQNRNRHALSITHENGKPSKIVEFISKKTLFLHYQSFGSRLLHYVEHGSDFTFLKYDSYNRLKRIYRPTRFDEIGNNNAVVDIPLGPQGISYPVTVTAPETDRLIRVRVGIDHLRPDTLRVFLTSPSGKTVQIGAASGRDQFLDDFLGENLSGVWTLKAIDSFDDSVSGAVTVFRIFQARSPANWTQYDYDIYPFNRITKISDSKGNRISSNQYDSNGRVVFQDDGRDDNGAWIFDYETYANGDTQTSVSDRTVAANTTTYLHDNEFRLKSIVDALGSKTQFFYNAGTLDRSQIIDARNNSTRFLYDSQGRGFLTRVIDPNGAETRFGYDEFPIEGDDGSVRGNLTTVIDGLNNKSTYKYDVFNNLITIKNALGLEQSKTYDQNGQLIITVNKDYDGLETAYTDGMLTSINILNGPEEKIAYESSGRVEKITDAVGNSNSIIYDLSGNIIEKRNDLGDRIISTYDQQDRLIAETDAENNTTRYVYDGNSNVIRIIDALNNSTWFEYDGEDRLIRVTDQNNNFKQTRYDAVGQVTLQIDELERSVAYTYDEVGNVVSIYGPTGLRVSNTTYNNLNLPVSQTDAHGNTTTLEYDLIGQLISKTDPTGKKTQMKVDALGRVDRVIDPLGRTYQKQFTDDDTLDKLLDASLKETKFTYTDKNQVESITTPRNFVTKIEYNGADYISRYIPPSQKAQEYTYSKASRLERIKHLPAGPPDILNAYDKNGNLTRVSTQDSPNAPVVPKITRTYDELSRLASSTNAESKTIRYRYNSVGLVDQMTYPDGKKVNYSYDDAKRLKWVTDWAGRRTTYLWNIHNRLDSILFPNDTLRVMTYDETGRLWSRADFDAEGAIIVDYDYSYDRDGFISTERLHVDPVVYEPQTSNFTYDDDNRLVAKNGVSITYDSDGNVTTGPVAGQTTTFAWDAHNNLVSTGAISFNNDVEDRLVGWVNGSETVKFTSVEASGGSQILVKESSFGNTTRYVYGVGLAYAEVDGKIQVHHYDERGNTVALSNESGRSSGTLAYSPYGEIIHQSGETDTIFKYAGLFGVVTAPNGMNYMRYRWYSPEMKRFISIDSSLGDIILPSSLNRYSYAGNNPINFTDPEGEFLSAFIGGVVGAVVGATVELVGSAIKGEPVNWNNVAAAAIGGAVQGAMAAAGCPACGGAIGSITEDLVAAGLNGDSVNIGNVAVGAVTGAVTGKIGAKVGRSAGRAISKYKAKKAIQKAVKKGLFPGEIAVGKVRSTTAKSLLKSYSIKGVIKFPFRVSGDLISDETESMYPQVMTAVAGLFGRTAKTVQAATALPTVNIGRGGEYLHNQRYLEALVLADRPLPDTPLAISSF